MKEYDILVFHTEPDSQLSLVDGTGGKYPSYKQLHCKNSSACPLNTILSQYGNFQGPMDTNTFLQYINIDPQKFFCNRQLRLGVCKDCDSLLYKPSLLCRYSEIEECLRRPTQSIKQLATQLRTVSNNLKGKITIGYSYKTEA